MGDPTLLAIQSRIEQLGSSNCCASDEEDLLRECVLQLQGQFSQIIGEYSDDVSSLQPQDKDTYLENLKGELSSLKAENAKLSDEVGNLTAAYFEDFIRLQSKIEEQKASLEFIQSQVSCHQLIYLLYDFIYLTEQIDNLTLFFVVHITLPSLRFDNVAFWHAIAMIRYVLCSLYCLCFFLCNYCLLIGLFNGFIFSSLKILELNGQIEKGKRILASLENLDYARKRFEGLVKMEDALTGLKVIEYDGNRISLSIRTYLPEVEMAEQNHELAIELLDDTLELKNAEIFPNDVYIGEIIGAAQSMAHQFSLLPISENSLGFFVQRVQEKIVLSTLRKSLVKAASKSRHFIEYADKDEIIIAHLVDGVEACIKVSPGWPITSSPLKLLSLKASSQSSKEVTFSFLCKVEERVNSLDGQVCQNLSTFVDAIEEIYTQRMRIEIQSDSSNNK
ncbi:uncharacterized protein LOC143586999 [Bidens hawaiensis]|uniref:uncharacterized protein LOC143586999 n=1 Tax=Bidens hawaiensis TaxID=980011 RepID=UPI00404AD82B